MPVSSNNFYLRILFSLISLCLFASCPIEAQEGLSVEVPLCSKNNISIHFEESVEFEAENLPYLCQIVETYRSQLNSVFSLGKKSSISIFIMSEASLNKMLCQWCEAVTIDGIVYLPSSLVNANENLETLHHEIIHAYIYSITGDRIPAWIEEGLAQIISGQAREVIKVPSGSFNLRTLRKEFKYPDAEEMLKAYDISILAVRYLLENFGFKHFGEYMKKLSYGYSHERAFISVFRITEDELGKIYLLHPDN
jgi:hypothetical protein